MIRLYRLIVLVLTIISCQTPVETQLPDVKANLFKAGTIDLQVATQNKVTLLTIWSIFCGPCLKELPELQTVYDRYKLNKRVTVLTLALNTNEELNRFLSTSNSADIYRKIFVHSGLKQLTLPILVGTTSPYQIENGSARLRACLKMLEHPVDVGQIHERFVRIDSTFIVFTKPSRPIHPGKRSLDFPAHGQDLKTG